MNQYVLSSEHKNKGNHTSTDNKWFIIDDGLTFEGDRDMFRNCFFDNASDENIIGWCQDNGYKLEIKENGVTMYCQKGDCASELWAVVDKDGNILYSRGGSSTKAHLMVYPNELSAKRGLNNTWTKQVIDAEKMEIKCIYRIN